MPIYFYRERDKPHGCFSNFSPHGFELDGKHWPTSEHYFQAMKFVGTPHEEQVRLAPRPMDAANLGRDKTLPPRPDWEQVKDDLMRRAVLAKFQAHADLREILLGTGDEELIEETSRDYYWGCGTDRTGKNMLGKILMETRGKLRGTSHETVTLYRPVGQKELDLIRDSGFRAFPPRLSFQPIFYPVLTEDYAVQIARDWNTTDAASDYVGYVTRFHVRADYLNAFPVQTVGSSEHQEYWIPAEGMDTFNQNIIGTIEVVAEFHPS